MHTSSQFVRLLDEQVRSVAQNTYAELPSMIEKFYTRTSSDRAWEDFYQIGDVPDIPEFNGKLSSLSVAPGYHVRIEHIEHGGKLDFERKLLDDKKYKVLENMGSELMKAAHRTMEKKSVRVFNNAFSTAYDYMTENEEGVALCSDSHPTKSGVSTSTGFDNAGTSAMNKTSIAATRLLMRRFKSDIGERIDIGDQLAIVCPDNLADLAGEIVGTAAGYDTAAQDKNMDYGRYEIIAHRRLDDNDTNNWFMVDKAKMKSFLMWFDRIKPEVSTTVDFETFVFMIGIYFRFSYGWTNWRWVFGHNVS